ncbi:MAG: phosphomannomutase/phosphoglucomutase [Patescibacteria group bacterium]|nr:phosphomannomutase/phosphoglucomutase [Patescibacteria group bacterium]
MDQKIFKSYDVRGIYPDTINEEIAEKIGIAFVNQFKLKKVAVGRDGRLSSPVLAKAVILGITRAGAEAVDLGIVSTDMVYFASANYDFDGALNVTASHNPSEYNGFKFVLRGAIAISSQDGLYDIRDRIVENKLEQAPTVGEVSTLEIYGDYIKKLLSLIDVKKIKPLKIVVDAGNGVAGYVIEKLFKTLPVKIIPLYFEIDGKFPNHQPSPIEDENKVDLRAKVLEVKADLGMAFDGDGDRVFLVDEKGQDVSATVMTAMIAKKMLERLPKSRILYNVICGWIVPETIQKYGGVPSITKVGHSLIKAQMRKEDGLFAGEHSGHYYFKDLFYADSGMLASLIMFELICEESKPLSEIAQAYNKYYLSGEINSKVGDQKAILENLKSKYNDGKQSELDGLSVEYPDWRFNVRASNTEPLLRLNVEAKNQELMETKRDELLTLIRK